MTGRQVKLKHSLLSTLIYYLVLPFFPFKLHLDTVTESFLDVCGSIVDESINNHGLRRFPPWSKPFGPVKTSNTYINSISMLILASRPKKKRRSFCLCRVNDNNHLGSKNHYININKTHSRPYSSVIDSNSTNQNLSWCSGRKHYTTHKDIL